MLLEPSFLCYLDLLFPVHKNEEEYKKLCYVKIKYRVEGAKSAPSTLISVISVVWAFYLCHAPRL